MDAPEALNFEGAAAGHIRVIWRLGESILKINVVSKRLKLDLQILRIRPVSRDTDSSVGLQQSFLGSALQ